jgi:glycosyltransferase involved in cell wall biosynthesis
VSAVQYNLCLCMIVRDEAHVITECLDSVLPYIDYWVICDTGSTDDTAKIIQDYFREKGIPGELHAHEWVDFGHNRSLALDLVRGKSRYAWVIDADDYIVGTPDLSDLQHGSYDLFYRLGDNCAYWRRQIFRMDLPWRYKGVVHEFAHCDEPADHNRLPGSYHVAARKLGGARNRSEDKYARDVALLERAHSDEPEDTRTVFYLAQSHYDHGNMSMAEHWYRKRAAMGGWEEEIFYSKLRIALALESQEGSFNQVRSALLDAWEYRPQRVEPLVHLARMCRLKGDWNQAYIFAKQADETPYPETDLLFVDESVWHWRAKDECAIAAYWTGRYEESERLCRALIESTCLPGQQLKRVKDNLDFALQAKVPRA